MDLKKSFYRFFAARVAAAIILVAPSVAMAGQVTGAIFTTLIDGKAVNHNIYDVKEDVYLNGGPQPNSPCTAAGLPDGDYFFQVTDPSGKVLLSLDSIENRRVTSLGGVFVNAGEHYSPQLDDTLPLGQCHGITVQLAPFNSSPNTGGEYKVWVTKVSDYKLGSGSFGFVQNKAKTDNFKVPNIDSDGDGIPDSEDNCPSFFDPQNICGGPILQ